MEGAEISSPCTNKCSIDHETNLCVGCYRTMEEIIRWLEFTLKEKEEILDKIRIRKLSLQSTHD
jgi:uncharacterized protein